MPATRSPPPSRLPAPLPARPSGAMPCPADQTAECAVLFLDVVRYSEQPLAIQREIKNSINAAVKQATARLAPAERVLLDTGDGVAIAFLGSPEDALFVALGLRRALGAPAEGRPVPLRTGINFGKVSVLRDVNGQPSVIGDGINMAQRVMSFANPGQLLVSQPFYQVLVGLSEDYGALFAYCGARTDKHVREHEVYELAAPLAQLDIALPAYMVPRPVPRAAEPPAPPPMRVRPAALPLGARRLAWAALIASLVLAVHAVTSPPAVESVRPDRALVSPARAETRAPAPAAARDRRVRHAHAAPTAAVRPAPIGEAPVAGVPIPTSAARDEALALEPPAQGAPTEEASAHATVATSATLAFAVAPWGEVRVNGQSYGASPPLTHLPLPPGEHRIEIDNSVSDPYRTVVRLEAGQVVRIQHSFERARAGD